MASQFRMDSKPGSLIHVGGSYESWLAVLEKVGWKCTQCSDLRQANELFAEAGPCIGIVDLSHDEFSLNGIANLVSNYKQVRWLAFIRESQLGSDTICQFIVNFCIDFFTAPIPDAQLLNTIGHQLGMLKLEKKVWPHYDSEDNIGLIGESAPIKRLRDQIKRIGPTDVSILISGENGVGKELVASAIHKTSARSQKEFISVNCRAMSERRLECDLFGIEREDDTQISMLERADGGTILLNDVLTLPKTQQLNLLRFFQEGRVESAKGSIDVDVRILSANSSDMEKALIDGEFNEELYHYINVLRINVPSLKERSNDVVMLARHFLQEFSKEFNAQPRTLSTEAMEALSDHYWPGNVRELINQIKRAVLMSENATLQVTDFELPSSDESARSLKGIRERSEKEALRLALEFNEGQVSIAAKELGISRATMYRLLNKHNLINEELV
ncbi:sigma-54 dependent transcriptional regulator [Vibrio sp. S4M6]|uniref:sigma-54-dependent transcriptional regulator n=1 Tax=Vibrio sinus TaxID=2946865 RepID=UPI00202A658D|nr:sigma-54 dependent transcriptional regulator [Vibrio sinus]MCL9781396.1 sigma-54 dependent transcriptional regulator [Vibrio sinus]